MHTCRRFYIFQLIYRGYMNDKISYVFFQFLNRFSDKIYIYVLGKY